MALTFALSIELCAPIPILRHRPRWDAIEAEPQPATSCGGLSCAAPPRWYRPRPGHRRRRCHHLLAWPAGAAAPCPSQMRELIHQPSIAIQAVAAPQTWLPTWAATHGGGQRTCRVGCDPSAPPPRALAPATTPPQRAHPAAQGRRQPSQRPERLVTPVRGQRTCECQAGWGSVPGAETWRRRSSRSDPRMK